MRFCSRNRSMKKDLGLEKWVRCSRIIKCRLCSMRRLSFNLKLSKMLCFPKILLAYRRRGEVDIWIRLFKGVLLVMEDRLSKMWHWDKKDSRFLRSQELLEIWRLKKMMKRMHTQIIRCKNKKNLIRIYKFKMKMNNYLKMILMDLKIQHKKHL